MSLVQTVRVPPKLEHLPLSRILEMADAYIAVEEAMSKAAQESWELTKKKHFSDCTCDACKVRQMFLKAFNSSHKGS